MVFCHEEAKTGVKDSEKCWYAERYILQCTNWLQAVLDASITKPLLLRDTTLEPPVRLSAAYHCAYCLSGTRDRHWQQKGLLKKLMSSILSKCRALGFGGKRMRLD